MEGIDEALLNKYVAPEARAMYDRSPLVGSVHHRAAPGSGRLVPFYCGMAAARKV